MTGVAAYDVAIVGARVAGSITATLLGEAGLRVLLVDAASFPSDTISTHFFRGAGLVDELHRLGVLDEVLALRSPPLVEKLVFEGPATSPLIEAIEAPGDAGYALCVRRVALDRILLERARRTPGVTVRERTPVRDLLRDGAGRVVGVVVQSEAGPEPISARLVVGADGRASFVARATGAALERTEPATRAMYFRYVRGYRPLHGTPTGPEFSFQGDELVYTFPSDDDVTCVAISVNLGAFEVFRADPAGSLDARVAAHPGVADRYAAASPLGRVLGSGPKDAVVRTPAGPGWALVGDACLHQDPWSGLGMDNAAAHARALAESTIEWLAGRTSEADAFARYHQRRDDASLQGFEFTARYGRDLSAAG